MKNHKHRNHYQKENEDYYSAKIQDLKEFNKKLKEMITQSKSEGEEQLRTTNMQRSTELKNIIINGSFSYGRAGIMSISQQSYVKIVGSIFNDSLAKSASICNLNIKSTIILSNCTLLNVIALQQGGLFLIFSENLMFLKNTSISKLLQERSCIISMEMKNIIFAENVQFIEFYAHEEVFLIGNNNKAFFFLIDGNACLFF